MPTIETISYKHYPVALARAMYQPSAPLLESRKAALHVLQIWICLDVLVAVAKLIPQLGLVQFDIILQLGKVLLLLCAKRGLLVLLSVLLLLGTAWFLLLLQLIHTSHHLHDLLVLVLLSTTHALLLKDGLSLDDLLLQILQLLGLCRAEASTFLFGLLLGLFLAHHLRFLFWLGNWSIRQHGCFGHEVSKLRFQTLHDLAGIHILLPSLQFSHLLALGSTLLLVVLPSQQGSFILQGHDLCLDHGLILLSLRLVILRCSASLSFEEL
mmetsp:Transcript_54490/g.86632  ORF Transcript_54490/g.86632 Transcript_54490/m.86632 type:complete len:268 (+) Transcript_54490:26-829(+)